MKHADMKVFNAQTCREPYMEDNRSSPHPPTKKKLMVGDQIYISKNKRVFVKG